LRATKANSFEGLCQPIFLRIVQGACLKFFELSSLE